MSRIPRFDGETIKTAALNYHLHAPRLPKAMEIPGDDMVLILPSMQEAGVHHLPMYQSMRRSGRAMVIIRAKKRIPNREPETTEMVYLVQGTTEIQRVIRMFILTLSPMTVSQMCKATIHSVTAAANQHAGSLALETLFMSLMKAHFSC